MKYCSKRISFWNNVSSKTHHLSIGIQELGVSDTVSTSHDLTLYFGFRVKPGTGFRFFIHFT